MQSHEIKMVRWMKGEINEWTQNTLEIPVSICICVQIVAFCDIMKNCVSPNQLKYVLHWFKNELHNFVK